MGSEKRIQSVGNATRLLKVLTEAGGPLRLNDLSFRLNMTKSSVHLLLATLADAGFVEQTTEGTYRLGLGIFEVGTAALQQLGLGAVLSPPLEALAERTREAVTLGVLHRNEVLMVQRFESDQVLRASIRVGRRMPVHSSASGRALLAFLPKEDRDALLAASEISAAELRRVVRRLRDIRDAGYEIQRDEWAAGISSIAAPVFGVTGAPVAAVSISSPSSRFDPQPLIEPLLHIANELGRLLLQVQAGPGHLARMAH
ncbi:IclR family transcriptional regulator [Mycobacterium sp. AZCC_0083]|uniref:IclR family transcriptional regulator n=1 Tax=Mycobacterium sp. AZCC_0083 TaxID=2735882 RepID=UPI0016112761|nr:IclR family transcriptional regulator [Mycobacterium sp. AZCC_0083]MBB5167531.1 DNA-binding IclR family transcriptional regulator [Mycobacterium sp. AZCC_0083]